MRKTLLVILLLVVTALALGIRVRDRCPGAANDTIAAGWRAFARGDTAAAGRAFRAGTTQCPEHVGGLNGLGFVALRAGDLAAARKAFDHARRNAPDDPDALVGAGITEFQAGEYETAYTLFQRARAVDPYRAEPKEYLAQMPPGLGTPPPMPALRLPDTLETHVRAEGTAFAVQDTTGAWRHFYVKGVNLGAALPGRHASEFPDSATYAEWIDGIAALGANTIRVYTLHPPAFYGALRAYDLAHADAPLRLIQGVWAELPPRDDYLDADWQRAFDADLRTAVDIVHGRADLRPRRGRASGFYRADVSPWTLAFLIGREWEPYSVAAFDSLHREFRGWAGRFVRADSVTPMEAVLARALDVLVTRESDGYREQHPAAFVNWPLLDPLRHATEASQAQELGFRRALGEKIAGVPIPFDADAAQLDASRMSATAGFRAGLFASYHVYPYWPDFMGHEAAVPDRRGRSGFERYVAALRDHHATMPLLVAEYGLPASIGAAHLQPEGREHGGVPERRAAGMLAAMTREAATAGAAGSVAFEWQDEWFKKSWIALPLTVPLERNRLWKNPLDPEENFGLIALDPVPPIPGADLAARLPAWHQLPPLAPAQDGLVVRAAADAAYLWLLVEHPTTPNAETYVGFDIWNPRSGAFRWPAQPTGPALAAGIEFALVARPGDVRLLAQPAANPFRVVPIVDTVATRATLPFPLRGPLPPGVFQGHLLARLNESSVPVADSSAIYDSLRMVLNSRRFTPQGQQYPALGYDRGVLPRGEAPDGLWSTRPGVLEVRIPWTLLDVTDPSARRILEHSRARWLPARSRPRRPATPTHSPPRSSPASASSPPRTRLPGRGRSGRPPGRRGRRSPGPPGRCRAGRAAGDRPTTRCASRSAR